MTRLEALFSPAQRERLCAAIPRRQSCRAFAGTPSQGDWAALGYAAGRYELPGARLIFAAVPEGLFSGALLGMGRITGCGAIAAVVASIALPEGRVHAGILGEAFCLEATAMGLGTCWVSGSYRKKQLTLPLKPDEALLAVIAVGVPEKKNAAETRRRKSLDRLCRGDTGLWPEEVRRAAQAVQIAPSAMNLQPWTMSLEQDRFAIDVPDRSRLELGIALCHAELALTSPHTWRLGDGRREPSAWAALR